MEKQKRKVVLDLPSQIGLTVYSYVELATVFIFDGSRSDGGEEINVLAIPNLRIYAWCRCKVLVDAGSEGHLRCTSMLEMFENVYTARRRATPC